MASPDVTDPSPAGKATTTSTAAIASSAQDARPGSSTSVKGHAGSITAAPANQPMTTAASVPDAMDTNRASSISASGDAGRPSEKVEDVIVTAAVPATGADDAARATGVERLENDPLGLSQHKREVDKAELRSQHKRRTAKRLNKFYNQQNELIDQFLNSNDEERLAVLDNIKYGPRVKFAIYSSFAVNCGLFVIQLTAAILTGSLSLFATTADAFVSPQSASPDDYFLSAIAQHSPCKPPLAQWLILASPPDGSCIQCGDADHQPNGEKREHLQVSSGKFN